MDTQVYGKPNFKGTQNVPQKPAIKKKQNAVKCFIYLQNNGTSSYESVVKEIQELMVNKVIDQSYKIINLVTGFKSLL